MGKRTRSVSGRKLGKAQEGVLRWGVSERKQKCRGEARGQENQAYASCHQTEAHREGTTVL